MVSLVRETKWGPWIVRTGWMGGPCGLTYGPPPEYETFVLNRHRVSMKWNDRYQTEAQAIRGHNRIVRRIKVGEHM